MNCVVKENYRSPIKIDVVTIDELCRNRSFQLMKMEVEGFEKFALAGAKLSLQNNELKAIILELNNSGERFGVKDEEVYQQIPAWGFLPYAYDPFKKSLTQLTSYNRDDFNTLFIKDLDFVEKRIAESKPVIIWGTQV